MVRRSPPLRSVSSAPSAIRAGGMSPIGEPLAILPPIVPALRTWSAADAADQLAEIGVEAGERLARLGIADAGAERERRPALSSIRLQIGDVADEDDRCRGRDAAWSPTGRHRWRRRRSASRDARAGGRPARRRLRRESAVPSAAARARAAPRRCRCRRSAAGGIGLAGRRGSGRSRCSGTDCRR